MPKGKEQPRPAAEKKEKEGAKKRKASGISIDLPKGYVITPNGATSPKYIIDRKLTRGGFGDVYSAHNKTTREEVIVKIEPFARRHPQLPFEKQVYDYIDVINKRRKTPLSGFGSMIMYTEHEKVRILVLKKLGPTLLDVMNAMPNGRLTVAQVISAALQGVRILKAMHAQLWLLHRDIKPENLLLGTTPATENVVHAIDFGFSKIYRFRDTREHIPYNENKPFLGTNRYASISTHLGIEHSRRDDLEQLCYTLRFLCKGSLPWSQFKQDQVDKIMTSKTVTNVDTLFHNCPSCLKAMFLHARSLCFEDTPDYAYLESMILKYARKCGLNLRTCFSEVVAEIQKQSNKK